MKTKEINVNIGALVKKNNGYCPCAVEQNEDTKCPCKMFRDAPVGDVCICGRFEKVEE